MISHPVDGDRSAAVLRELDQVRSAPLRDDIEGIVLNALLKVGFSRGRWYYLTGKDELILHHDSAWSSSEIGSKPQLILPKRKEDSKSNVSYAALEFGKPLVVRVSPELPFDLSVKTAANGIPHVTATSAPFQE